MPLPSAPIDDLARQQVSDVFGHPPTVVVSAPGRVNMIGEHIDLLDESMLKRARHVITEAARTQDAVPAIEAEDWKGFVDLLYASHQSLQSDYQVSCAELDLPVSIGQDIGIAGGVYGERTTGAGFGVSTVSLIATTHAESILATYRERYQQDRNHELEAFVTRPSHGAGVACATSNSTQ